MKTPGPTPNRKVFRLLWKAARKRSEARKRRQRELINRKTGKGSNPLDGLMFLFSIGIMVFVHAALGWVLIDTAETTRVIDAERNGKVVLEHYKLAELKEIEANGSSDMHRFYRLESSRRAGEFGEDEDAGLELLRTQYERYGSDGFVSRGGFSGFGISDAKDLPDSALILAGFIFLWWLTMVVCQGEGLELDIQRRRHSMWEWVQSHPVRPVAAFAADLLAPMMANPVYFSAPVFWWIVFGSAYGAGIGFLMSVPVGLAFAFAGSVLNKALEISVMLRMAPRNRGAVLGLMSWLGYAGMMLPLFIFQSEALKIFLARQSGKIADFLPVFPVRWALVGWSGEPVAWQAGVVGMASAGLLLAFAVLVAWWGSNLGLQGTDNARKLRTRPASVSSGKKFLAGNPLYRKELLWFWRDKGAVIQALLIPLTVASLQVFNLRGLMGGTLGSWNGICGAAIICGTYFLLVLGPRSLASEGAALWVATGWPRGLEDLLKAKARLWWAFSSIIVLAVLAVAVWMFPADWWRILLVAGGWAVFGKSLSEKAVTLATVASSSGEPEPVPKGRQWAAMLGTFVFSAGVFTANWSLAVVGVVFSTLTASAMWQNFRARLPYIFDPWSEKLPPAPSLMHSMIAIAAMVEALGLVAVLIHAFSVDAGIWFAQTLAYGLVAVVTWQVMTAFLGKRGVTPQMVWRWDRGNTRPGPVAAYACALVLGALMALVAALYLQGLRSFTPTLEFMHGIDSMVTSERGYIFLIFILSVGMAPLAEEFLFRGLLYRSLDREKGGISALMWSSAYFAIYHPPVSWIPVFFVGMSCGWLFKRSGRLGPSVLVHMTYNALVVLSQ